MQAYQIVCAFELVCRCVRILAGGKREFRGAFSVTGVGVVKASRCKVDMAVYGPLFHMLLWMDVTLSMDVGFSSLRCCVFARELKL